MRSICLALLLLVVSFGGVEGVAVSGCDPSETWYDYYLLVLQWPNSYAGQKQERNFFTIHGLWPSRVIDADSYPCSCRDDEPFEISKIDPVDLEEMKKVWVSLFNNNKNNNINAGKVSSNEDFWNHEWSKHGTCCTGFSLADYFHRTLQLRSKFDPFEVLKDQMDNGDGKQPPVRTDVARIKKAIRERYSVGLSLGCFFSKQEVINGQAQSVQRLAEIAVCLSYPSYDQPLNAGCPDSLKHETSSEITNCVRDIPILIPNYITQESHYFDNNNAEIA